MAEAPLNEGTSQARTPVAELARLFLRLGTIAFGGPAAHIALMEDEVVRRRGWLSHADFIDLLAVTNLIPGPNSTEMAIHIGYRRGGWRGLIVAGSCFILPAFLIVLLLAWMYGRYRSLPAVEQILLGVTPVMIAIILQALWRLGRSVLKTVTLIVVATGSATLNLAGLHELLVLALAAMAVLAIRLAARHPRDGMLPGINPLPLALGPLASFAPSVGIAPLFLIFLKIGSVLYGSGYVLLAFLRADFVQRHGWLTEQQLLDAVAVGQVTPGPVFTTATFIGYILGGVPGAVAATVGIFLPGFIFVAISARMLPRLRSSPAFAAILDGLNAGSLALMAVVSGFLARTALADWRGVLIAAVSLTLLLRYSVNSTWLVAGGVVAGIILF